MMLSKISPSLQSIRLEVNGIYLHVMVSGPEDGQPLLFLHGFPEFWYAWRRQINYFVGLGYRVIVPDQRGHNLSDRPAHISDYTLEKLGADITSLLDKMGYNKAYLVGHDWGGAVAWWIATVHPEKVIKVAILNAPHPVLMKRALWTNPAQIKKNLYVFLFQIPKFPEWLFRANKFALGTWSLSKASQNGTFSKEDLEHYYESWKRPGVIHSMINWYRAGLRMKLKTFFNLGRVSIPVLIIWGAKDRFLGRELAQSNLKFCDHGRLEIIEDAGHWIQHEAPDKVNKLLADHFEHKKLNYQV